MSRSVRVDGQFGRGYGSFFAGDEGDEALTGVRMLKPPAHKNDSANYLVGICWASAHAQLSGLSHQAPNRLHAPSGDHDPSRSAVGHGNGDFGRRAWRDHAGSPDSVAELPFVCGDGLVVHRFRRSRSGLDRTAGRREPESGSDHTETSCKTLPQHKQDCTPFVKARTLPLSGLAIISGSSPQATDIA